MSMSFNLAWRLFRHEARRGELTIILLAIVLSVGAVLSLSLFSERLQGALKSRSAAFIAADAQLRSDKPIDETWFDKARDEGLSTAKQVTTRSMAFNGDEMTSVDLRAVNTTYPLKGKVNITDQPFGEKQAANLLPEPGHVWVQSRLFQTLGLAIGDAIEIGDGIFVVSKVLVDIPDAGFSIFSTDPIVLMNLDDLDKTAVTGPGSRVRYVGFFAGEPDVVENFNNWLLPQLNDDLHSWRTIEDDESAIGASVARAERYFLLASLLAIVLAAVSIAVAAQRYAQRHFDPVAIMKTLGATAKTIRKIYLIQILLITALGISIGLVIGFIGQQIVVQLVADSVDVTLDVWHWRPVIIAVATGATCALLFSLYPLLQLFSVPPLRVLRKDISASMRSKSIQFIASGGAIFFLMWMYSQDLKISAILFFSGAVLVAGLLGATFLLIAVGRRLGSGSMGPWQLAWARIKRRAMDNSVQLISFSVTIMLLLVVLVMRNDMVSQWRSQLPEGTPNYFLINITPDIKPSLDRHFKDNGITINEFYPVIRGRFVSVNGEGVNTEVSKEDDANREGRRGLGREANLTWSNVLQKENEVVEGIWHGTANANYSEGRFPVSVEAEVAKRLEIKLNDMLTFNVGSEIVETKVTSIRKVNWQTMQPNFFFVIHPEAMASFKPTFITSFHLPTEQKSELTALLKPFGSITMFDVDARINQLREIVDQVSVAVEFILVLVLLAGTLVLVAQVQASMDERRQEIAILRTLGAKGALIRQSVIFEFVIIGSVAGFMAALANELSLYMLQTSVFKMKASLHFEYWAIAPTVGAIVVGLLGAMGCWRLLTLNTSQMLRKMV
ncbi:ABC transporter permease [Alteromonas sp. KUL42]|uniref:ABC transporter permease n=1 Tax=Alteromonas sp. KUL42 TaxID=2480797 RepID=UPI001035C8CD|nr:FtsX-like permease family protein [Alteromonas sp. KUL42]TAP32161.1 FtsX-like permease family protein [Alteromonas sp. KUL42]GEA08952.1 ABC transporter permease [Alteromonas sp. KUL42]